MLLKALLLVLTIQFISMSPEEEELIKYYENLINKEIDRASKYQFPKDASEYKGENENPIDFGTFDFIIVGAGSAGAVVANRLSEIPSWKILLLEAGNEETNFTLIPEMSAYALKLEKNWGFNSTRQSTCCLSFDGVCSLPRGRSLGGSSAINALIYSRGSKTDYDKWEALGNPHWSYADVLPYFKKSENSHILGDENYHGRGGYLDVNYHVPISDKVNAFIDANKEMGSCTLDYNGRSQLGTSRLQLNTIRGSRLSSSRAFLKPALERTNLNILTDAYVTNILINNKTKAAKGIYFSHNKINYFVGAEKEVILSAGVIGSAHLLLLSGIGPKEDLTKHGISVIKNLQVGKNMHDHSTFYNFLFLTSIFEPPLNLTESVRQYLRGRGPFTSTNDVQAVNFFNLKLKSNSSSPDFELVIIPALTSANLDEQKFGYIHPRQKKFFSSVLGNISQLVLVMLHPESRGSVYLKSKDPFQYPVIQSTCLNDPGNKDVETLYEGIKHVLKLFETSSFKKIDAQLFPYMPCATYPINSKDYWMCNIRETAMNAYHAAGTCSMGSAPSSGAVVDHNLRVHGISKLRVADASVIPITLSAHMSAPSMMIGEKAADIIKREYNQVV